MKDSKARFMGLSVALTGYDEAELQATGMGGLYYDTMVSTLGGALVGELLSAWVQVEEWAGGEADTLETLLHQHILSVPKLGPMARNLVTLWYLGQWNQMPGDWRSLYGAVAADQTRVVSAEAYREGLVWPTIGAHPMGAKQQGFGAWALPPENGRAHG